MQEKILSEAAQGHAVQVAGCSPALCGMRPRWKCKNLQGSTCNYFADS